MDAKYTISTTEARQRFADIIDTVQKTGVHYTFTTNGKPRAVLISAEEFESIMETLDVMSDPELIEAIAAGERDIQEGNTVNLTDILTDEAFI